VHKCSIIYGLRNRLNTVNIGSSSPFSLPLVSPSNSWFKIFWELISSCVYAVSILSLQALSAKKQTAGPASDVH